MDSPFKCINCGGSAKKLYQDYRNGIVKIEHCSVCGGLVDKYIEYDPVVICLDALLLKMQAFRHLLYNSQNKSHIKLTIILLLCDAFMKLMSEGRKRDTSYVMPEYVIYSALEWRLYWNYFLASLELLVYLLSLLSVNQIHSWRSSRLGSQASPRGNPPSPSCLIRAILLSNFGKVLVIPAVLWGHNHGNLVIWLSKVFVCSSNIQAVRAVNTKQSFMSIVLTVLIGQTVSIVTANWVNFVATIR